MTNEISRGLKVGNQPRKEQIVNIKQQRKLLQHQTLTKYHPQQYVFFKNPDNIHLDFTKPVACPLKQQVSQQRELGF